MNDIDKERYIYILLFDINNFYLGENDVTSRSYFEKKRNVLLFYIFGITVNDPQQKFLALQRSPLGTVKYNIIED